MASLAPRPRPRAQSSIPPISGGRILADKFEIRGVLGEGGTGIVYDAVRISDGRPVALKVMHSQLAGDRQIRGRFAREAAILARVEGPNLCPILESGLTPDPRREGVTLLYMALAKINGPPLDAYIKKQGALPEARAVEILVEVCRALTIAHASGVVHRDLKPANVLLENELHAIVVDFGMAKIVAGATMTTQLTQHNMIFGTPEYMAPEQARGDEVDERCDIYAAGVMLYELLTGTVPFSGPSPLGVLTAQMTSDPESPRLRAPDRDISPAVEAVVMNALAKDPAARYASARVLSAALQHARAEPENVPSVAPRRFDADSEELASAIASPDSTPTSTMVDAHAATMPAPIPSTPAPLSSSEASAPPSFVRAAVAKAALRARRQWTAVFIVAALIGIAMGIWLSIETR